jgi:hypothetical protein
MYLKLTSCELPEVDTLLPERGMATGGPGGGGGDGEGHTDFSMFHIVG